MSSDKSVIYDYERLLDRLYKLVPEPASSGERFEIPRPVTIYVGSVTIIKNFREIADRMKREPELLGKYLLKELATSGDYEESSGSFRLNVKVSSSSLYQLIERFAKLYVICPTCGRPDTYIKKTGRLWVLKCEACGAEQPLKPI
jgi:translation initiation factor 2 subunit 2